MSPKTAIKQSRGEARKTEQAQPRPTCTRCAKHVTGIPSTVYNQRTTPPPPRWVHEKHPCGIHITYSVTPNTQVHRCIRTPRLSWSELLKNMPRWIENYTWCFPMVNLAEKFLVGPSRTGSYSSSPPSRFKLLNRSHGSFLV